MKNTDEWWIKGSKHLMEELKSIGVCKKLEEVHKIQFLAERKYNRYSQYLPGETFQYRLVKWLLNNFEKDDMQVAMEIVDNLVYLNNQELQSLAISTFWNSVHTIQKEILNDKKRILQVHLDARKDQTNEAIRRSVFIAIADDVMFDFFRRFAQGRVKDLEKDNFVEYYKLHKTCQKEDLNYLEDFDRIFLIDQLCASGRTFLRKEENEWTGKIDRFFRIWENVDTKKTYYAPYIISTVAESRLSQILKEWQRERNINQEIKILPALKIPVSSCLCSNSVIEIDPTLPVAKLCKKYHDPDILHEHMKKGGKGIWGFGDAGLTLVLNTNSPNNTIPVIWRSCNNWYPLFPRIEHHH